MKKLLPLAALIFVSSGLFSQGSVQGFTVAPASPTTADNTTIYVDLMFSSSGCPVDNQGHSTSGSSTDAYAHHCVGMLSAICNTVDTFNVGMLSAGTHVFRYTLTSGSGGPPCTPGIIPDDVDSVSFIVSPTVGIQQSQATDPLIRFYPNPFNGSSVIQLHASTSLIDTELKIIDLLGKNLRTIRQLNSHEFIFKQENLPPGIYFYQLVEKQNIIATGKFIVK